MVESIHVIMILAGIAMFGAIAIPPFLHNVDTGANIIDQLFDVDTANSTDNDILIFNNGTWFTGNITQFLENETKSHLNVGGGAEVFKDENLTDARFRTLVGGGGVSVVQNADTISIVTGGGGPNGSAALQAVAQGVSSNVVYNATNDGPVLTVVGDGISITPSASVLFAINASVGRLNDVNVTAVDQNQFLIYNSTSNAFENKPISRLLLLKNVYFNAEEATVDDMTGTNCVNDITYDFFDNTDVNEYRRQVVEFCANSDPDDNLTWLYTVPPFYEERDFKFKLFWSDDNSEAGAYMASTSEDCEESIGPINTGDVTCSSSDLELHAENIVEADDNDIVGMRFTGVTIPNAATITDARIQFHVDSTNPDEPIIVVFRGEDVDDSAVLTSADFDLSSRTNTTASVQWDVPDWVNTHDEGAAQLSADLSTIIQEIVDRGGWVSGNDITIMINEWVGCTVASCPVNFGERHAESEEGESGNQPEITITFSTGGAGPVCFEISLLVVSNAGLLDAAFTARDTVCINRSGLDQLSTTEWIVLETDHQFEAEDLVMIKIHRPDDFVINDYESDVYVLGGALEWID